MIRIQTRLIPTSPVLHILDSALLTLHRVAVSIAKLRHHPILLLCLAGVVVESLLLGRLWVQVTDKPAGGVAGIVLDLSAPLASPFQRMDGIVPIKETGIFEFATLAAIEAYLVFGLGFILAWYAAGEIVRDIARIIRPGRRGGPSAPAAALGRRPQQSWRAVDHDSKPNSASRRRKSQA